MTDLPLPEPAAGYGAGCNIELTIGQHLYTADQLHAYAAAKTAEIEAECARLRAAYLQQSKEFGYELRDPNGTIWDECRRLQAALDAALRGKE